MKSFVVRQFLRGRRRRRATTTSSPISPPTPESSKMSSIASSSTRKRPTRRFAPLDPEKPNSYAARKLRGIVFDVDGTLCLPQNYMFTEMRTALSIPSKVDILEHIRALPTPELQGKATRVIKEIESRAMSSQQPQPGLRELMAYLHGRKVKKALCTRNFQHPVDHLLHKFLRDRGGGDIDGSEKRVGRFHPVITRETANVAPKPSPEGLWKVALTWNPTAADTLMVSNANGHVDTDDPLEIAKRHLGAGMIMVGDSIDDMVCGHRAGAATVLLVNDQNEHLVEDEYTDLAIRRLDELIPMLENGFVGRGGWPLSLPKNHIEIEDD